MKVFATLLQREWMQHQRGWWIALALPFVLLLLAVTFGEADIGNEDEALNFPLPTFAAIFAISVIATLGLALASVLLQAPGLARRDQQDRSIEFWLSLPTPPVQSVAATLLAHLWLLPIAAVGVGIVGGFVLAPLGVMRGFGMGALADLPWGGLVLAALALAARLTLGILVASLWLAPLILVTMAASAWLKRWGVPVVIAGLLFGHLLVQRLFGSDLVARTIELWFNMAQRAFIVADRGESLRQFNHMMPTQISELLPMVLRWLGGDAWRGLATIAQPQFIVVLVISALAFAALVHSRRWGR